MRTVRDGDGTELFLVKASSDASLVEHPATGDQYYVPNDRLSSVSGPSLLQTAATVLPESPPDALATVHDDRALGLLVELHDRGPLAIRAILDRYDLCESDVHGVTGELRAASLIESTSVGGEPGYELTHAATEALTALFTAD